ncbi:cellulose synthase complex periplasmic endoglucanase BcsZ [Vulgatibacter sp.]|uniref:cellulose synthase complex periplasmic endoglucanase BcsZ n=1 Tax=Vulgatibacter sp. TaxID=1971226 RepID=UPI003569E811
MRGAILLLVLAAGCATAPVRNAAPDEPAAAQRRELLPPLPEPGQQGAGAADEATVIAMPPALGACDWPLFEHYVARFVSEDGRVIDRTDRDKSTSEGQSYGLFFALVAGDRPLFDKLLRWTEDHLAGGDLRRQLPAWKWGRAEDGRWRVLDANPASDADLWIAYVLHEAGRLWDEPSYIFLGRQVLALIEKHEVEDLPGLGPMMLPGPYGFEVEEGRAWRLNPSYLPPQLLRRFEERGPWRAVRENTLRLLRESTPAGLAADWILWHRDHGFGVDPVHGPMGSYDAIRVYLWAGFLDADDPLRAAWAGAVHGLWDEWRRQGHVPERLDVTDPGDSRAGPPGFVAALLPEAVARGDGAAAGELEALLARSWNGTLYGNPPTYYDQNLILFARGFVEGRYAFAPDGTLQTRWDGGGCGE